MPSKSTKKPISDKYLEYFDDVESGTGTGTGTMIPISSFKERTERVDKAYEKFILNHTKNNPEAEINERLIRKELYATANAFLMIPEKEKELIKVNIAELIEIVKRYGIMQYDKDLLDPKHRIEITIECEKHGLVCTSRSNLHNEKTNEEKNNEVHKVNEKGKSIFIITKTLDKEIDIMNLSKDFEELFSKHADGKISKEMFFADISKYGVKGFNRRNVIMKQHIYETIKQNPTYVKLCKAKHYLREKLNERASGLLEKSFAISKRLYSPTNDGLVYISLDIKSANFTAYKENRIIEQDTWYDFMKQFTMSEYLLNSKQFRIRLMGKLDNKMSKTLWETLTMDVWDSIKHVVANTSESNQSNQSNEIETKSELKLDNFPQLVAIESDEILIKPVNYKEMLTNLKSIDLPAYIKMDCFKLKYVDFGNNRTAFVKQYIYPENQSYDIKCVKREDYVKMAEDIKKMNF